MNHRSLSHCLSRISQAPTQAELERMWSDDMGEIMKRTTAIRQAYTTRWAELAKAARKVRT